MKERQADRRVVSGGHSTRAADLLRLVLYFDLFQHPLLGTELVTLGGPGAEEALAALIAAGRVEARGRYVVRPGRGALIGRRQARARHAERLWPWALRAARGLAAMPTVQGLFITGSLSKGSCEEDGDVDFLVVVSEGRVWTTKTLLQVLRRGLPARGRDLLCTNYLVGDQHLLVDDRNLFTAVELATAIPVYGQQAALGLVDANGWAARFVPGWAAVRSRAETVAPGRPAAPPAGPGIARLDALCRGAWDRFWEAKYAWLDGAVRAQRFKRRPERSTNHLHDFQAWVLTEMAARLKAEGLDPAVVLEEG